MLPEYSEADTVAKKDTSETIRAMLGEQGTRYRPSAQSAAAQAPKEPVNRPEEPPPVTTVTPAIASEPPHPTTTTSRRARARQAPSQVPDEQSGGNAPRTLRLSQPMANALREAWLLAKREDVLLTYQDFADRIVRD